MPGTDTATAAEALGPLVESLTLSEPSEPRLFRGDGSPVRFFEGIVPVMKPLGGRTEVIGTAFWLHRDGIFATAAHLVADPKADSSFGMRFLFDARESPGRSYLRQVRYAAVASGPDAPDVAVGFASTTAAGSDEVLKNAHFRCTERHPQKGETLYSYGYPRNEIVDARNPTVRGVVVEGRYLQLIEPGDYMWKYPCFRAEIKIDHAASGSPVFDADGNVCAVAFSSITELEDEPPPPPIAHLLPMSSFLDLELTEVMGGDKQTTVRDILASR